MAEAAVASHLLGAWRVRIDDVGQAAAHEYVLAGDLSEKEAMREAARRAIIDDPNGAGIRGAADPELRLSQSRTLDVVDAVAQFATAVRAQVDG